MKISKKGDSAVNTYRLKYYQKGMVVSLVCYDLEGDLVQWKPAGDNLANIEQDQQPAQELEQ
jgi:hypothetical protein